MITYNTLNNIIDHYEKLLSTAKSYGYTDLRFFSSGNEEEGVLSILAKYTQAEPEFLFKDINEALAEILDTDVYLIAEGCREADSAFLRQEAEKAPLLDMKKTINYFFDSIIPVAIGEESDEKKRKDILEKWETSHVHMQALKLKDDKVGAVKEDDDGEPTVKTHEEDTRKSTKHAREESSDSYESTSPQKKQMPPISLKTPSMTSSNLLSFLGQERRIEPSLSLNISGNSSSLNPHRQALLDALLKEFEGEEEQLPTVVQKAIDNKKRIDQQHSKIPVVGQ